MSSDGHDVDRIDTMHHTLHGTLRGMPQHRSLFCNVIDLPYFKRMHSHVSWMKYLSPSSPILMFSLRNSGLT